MVKIAKIAEKLRAFDNPLLDKPSRRYSAVRPFMWGSWRWARSISAPVRESRSRGSDDCQGSTTRGEWIHPSDSPR
jgi:hypothetical protein